jgi:hypothetical protein
MPQNNPPEPLDNPKDAWDPSFGLASKLLLFVALGTMCLVEVMVIRGLWFTHGAPPDTFAMYSIPIFVLFPGLTALLARMTVRSLLRKGEIQPTAAGRVQQIVSVSTLMTYLAIQSLARIAFR